MLLFIGPEPTPENERDGMVQRVKAIDQSFSDVPRKMLAVSLTRNWFARTARRSGTLEVEHINAFVHAFRLLRYARRADAIYIHSCIFALRAFPLFFFCKEIITDMHGVVPEEFAMLGLWRAGLYQLIERVVVHRSSALVFVTDAMRDHFLRKYPEIEARLYMIPIFSDMPVCPEPIERVAQLAVYSGGLYKWQCIDETLDLVQRTQQKMRFLFLTGEPDGLRRLIRRKKIDGLEVRSVDRHELASLYMRATYGFILRDSSIVNNVACPTKLVEYLESGVIPIVKEAEIGDFNRSGYCYVTVEEFERGKLPSFEELEAMRVTNKEVIRLLRQKSQKGILMLKEDLHLTKPGQRNDVLV